MYAKRPQGANRKPHRPLAARKGPQILSLDYQKINFIPN